MGFCWDIGARGLHKDQWSFIDFVATEDAVAEPYSDRFGVDVKVGGDFGDGEEALGAETVEAGS